MTDRELLAIFEKYAPQHGNPEDINNAIEALRARLAQPEREWVSLTDDDLHALHYELKCAAMGATSTLGMYRILEKALREKNT